jgi:formamidopyrimidine-DNA glycosylase
MPELPEVETIRRQLEKKIVGKKISRKKIKAVRRRAKILIIDFDDGSCFIFHLKLTGQLIFNGKTLPYTRKVFKFEDGTWLTFNDVRKFGWWKEIEKGSSEKEKEFGPEPLEMNRLNFIEIIKRHPRARIKPLLMNQKVIAGIGNIYSDEILFASNIHPARLAGSLSREEKVRLFENIKRILTLAIKLRGSSVEHYFDLEGKKGTFAQEHKVYQKEGQSCPKCGAIIEKTKIGGRSSRYCPRCQLLGTKKEIKNKKISRK